MHVFNRLVGCVSFVLDLAVSLIWLCYSDYFFFFFFIFFFYLNCGWKWHSGLFWSLILCLGHLILELRHRIFFFFLADISIWCRCILRGNWCRLVVFVFSLLEKWGCLSPSFSAGSLPRRRCVFSWWVLTQLVRPRSFTSSSWERLSPPFLPLVSCFYIQLLISWINKWRNWCVLVTTIWCFVLDRSHWTCLFNLVVPYLLVLSSLSSQKVKVTNLL